MRWTPPPSLLIIAMGCGGGWGCTPAPRSETSEAIARRIQGLVDELRDDRLRIAIRRRAAEALGTIDSPEARESLERAYRDESLDIHLRADALHALANFPLPDGVGLFAEAMEDEAAPIHYRAGEALAEIGTPEAVAALVEGLRIHPACLFDEVVREVLARSPTDDTIEVLVRASGDERWTVRSSAVAVLESIGEAAVPGLTRAAADPGLGGRPSIIRLLGRHPTQATKEALLRALQDEDWMVRNEAAVALARSGGRDIVRPLIALLNHEEPRVREEAAWVLGRVGGEEAVAALRDAMAESGGSTRWMAAAALGVIGAEQAVEPLIDALKTGDPPLRRAAAWALARMRSPRAAAALKVALDDGDAEVRLWAEAALEGPSGP
ncbi:MAG: HEAT repeat domain-containing protein [Planctomycetes bacterium]|nr:HEAT repeat domain-containing protein [Planctomycetota bacterium]